MSRQLLLQCTWPPLDVIEEQIRLKVNKNVTGDSIFEQLLTLCRDLFQSDRTSLNDYPTVVMSIDLMLAVAYEHLNVGHWKDVPLSWRFAYSFITLCKAKSLVMSAQINDTRIAEALNAVDMGILMGAPLLDDLMPNLASALHKQLQATLPEDGPGTFPSPRQDLSKVENIPKLPEQISNNHRHLKRLRSLSVSDFMLQYLHSKEPCIIEGVANSWPAFSKWRDLSYFRKTCGLRTVPVEVGHRYTDSDWGQRLVTFSRFLDDFIVKASGNSSSSSASGDKGYLAQHQLLDQITELKRDIVIPDYCFANCDEDGDCDESKVEINAWFGAKSVSPLHQDPKDNILVQVVGRKFVYLFNPNETEKLYPFESDRLLSNTSQIDLLNNVDLAKFPRFTETTTGQYGFLEPGDALYIPENWWHFVSSSSSWSCSVSFWF